MTDDRFYHLSEQLFGDTDSITFKEADQRINETQAAQQEAGGTLALEDIPDAFEQEGLIGGLAHAGAAVANATSAFVGSAIQAYATGGAALAVDMVQGSVQDYTKQRAEELGVSYEEAAQQLGSDTIIPIALGALSYKFEKFGLKGVGKAIKGMAPSAKKAFVQLLNASGKEGATELAQGVVEAFNQGLGAENSLDEAAENVGKFLEEDALETFLQGAVGGGVSAGGGKAVRRAASVVRSREAENKIKESAEKIMELDAIINNPETPDSEKKILKRTRTSLKQEMKDAIKEPNAIVKKLTDENLAKINKKANDNRRLRDELNESRKVLGEDSEAFKIVQEDTNSRVQKNIDAINKVIELKESRNIREDDGDLIENETANLFFEGKKKGEISDEHARFVADEYENLAGRVATDLFRNYNEHGEQGYTKEDFVRDLKYGIPGRESSSLVGLAKGYDPEVGSFGGWAKSQLRNRAKDVLEQRIGKQATTGATTVVGGSNEEGGVDIAAPEGPEIDLKTPKGTRQIVDKVGLPQTFADKVKDKVANVLKSKKLNTATKQGFEKAVTAQAREALQKDVLAELNSKEGLNKKDAYFQNLVQNWKNYLDVIPKEGAYGLRNSRGETQNWVENPPSKQEFINYFRGVGAKGSAASDRKNSLAKFLADGIFAEAADDLLFSNADIAKQFEVVNAFKKGDAVSSVNAARIAFINKVPVSESRINGPKFTGYITKKEGATVADSITSILDQAWKQNGHNVTSTTSRVQAIGWLKDNGYSTEQAKNTVNDVHGLTFKDSNGVIHIYNDSKGSIATPIHEMGHVWSQFLMDNNPQLWGEIMTEILSDQRLTVNQSARLESYRDKFGDAAVDMINNFYNSPETIIPTLKEMARRPAKYQKEMGAIDELFAGIIEKHGKNRLNTQEGSKLQQLLDKFWDAIGKLLANVKGKEIKDLTTEQLLDLALNDITTGKPGSSFAEMNVPVGNLEFDELSRNYRKELSASQKVEQAKYEALNEIKSGTYAELDKAYQHVADFMTKDEFLDYIIDLQGNFDTAQPIDQSTEKLWAEAAGEKVKLLKGRPSKAWQNDQDKIDQKFDENFAFFKKYEAEFTKELPSEFFLMLATPQGDGTRKDSFLRVEDAEYLASQAKPSGLKWDNPDAFGRLKTNNIAKLNKLAKDPKYQAEAKANQDVLFAFGDAIQALAEAGVDKAALGTLVKSFTNTGDGKRNIFRRAPIYGGYAEGIQNSKASNIVPEHNPPAGYIALDMFKRAISGQWNQEAKDAIRNKFKYFVVDKALDPGVLGLGDTTLKSGISKGFDITKHDPIVRYIVAGGNAARLKDTNGEAIVENNYIKLREAGINVNVSESRKKQNKLHAFDFDDTLFNTNSKVIINKPDGSTELLNSEDFPGHELAQGESYDFTQFDQVIEPKALDALGLVKKALDKNEDVVILTARTMNAGDAVMKIMEETLGPKAKNIKFKGVGHSSADAKVNYLVNSINKHGYDNVFFTDDAVKNVEAVDKAFDKLNIEGRVKLAEANIPTLSESKKVPLSSQFNDILEQKTGVKANKTFDAVDIKNANKKFRLGKFWLPPSAEDLKGLIYSIIPSGKAGNAALEFFNEALFKPYSEGIAQYNKEKLAGFDSVKALAKKFDLKKDIGDGLTAEQAIRIYLFQESGQDLQGVSQDKIDAAVNYVNNVNPQSKGLIQKILNTTNGKFDTFEADTWLAGSLQGDMFGYFNDIRRKELLQPWRDNQQQIFSDDNLR